MGERADSKIEGLINGKIERLINKNSQIYCNEKNLEKKSFNSQNFLNKKPTNLDIVKVEVKPDIKTLPVMQHPEAAIVASPAPSPMTPTEDKILKMDIDSPKLDN